MSKIAECPHCGQMRDPDKCGADPYINKEPREYCPLANLALRRTSALSQADQKT